MNKEVIRRNLITVIAVVSSIIFLKEYFAFLHRLGYIFILFGESGVHKKKGGIISEKSI